MESSEQRPRIVAVVAWTSIVLGSFAVLAGVGNLVAQYVNWGMIGEYDAIVQILLGGLIVGSSVGLMYGKRIARDVLEITLWVALLGSVVWVAAQESDFRYMLALAMLQFWIPMGLLIHGVRKRAVRAFVGGT